jgi:hypothetical protein
MMPRSCQNGLKKIITVAIPLLLLFASRCGAQDFILGARGGISFDGGSQRFHEAEAFAQMELPWKWDFISDFYFRPGLDASAGWISDNAADGFIGTLGPMLKLGKGKFPVTLEAGVSPTILSRDRFGAKDFGDDVQFTSHIGVNWQVTKHFTVGWRFQHMSNAGLARPNPGVNLEILSIGYKF